MSISADINRNLTHRKDVVVTFSPVTAVTKRKCRGGKGKSVNVLKKKTLSIDWYNISRIIPALLSSRGRVLFDESISCRKPPWRADRPITCCPEQDERNHCHPAGESFEDSKVFRGAGRYRERSTRSVRSNLCRGAPIGVDLNSAKTSTLVLRRKWCAFARVFWVRDGRTTGARGIAQGEGDKVAVL